MRKFLLALAAVLAFSVAPAAAKDFVPYNNAKLEAAIKSGAPVVIHVHAEWCPVCRRQIVVLDELFKNPALAKIQTIRVNYDTERGFVSAYKVKRQANVLVFKDGEEVARVDYDPDADRIRAAVNRAL